jgi:hypothetical protein
MQKVPRGQNSVSQAVAHSANGVELPHGKAAAACEPAREQDPKGQAGEIVEGEQIPVVGCDHQVALLARGCPHRRSGGELRPRDRGPEQENVSGLPAWISDTLCRLATGGGFAVRQLYTDQDEVLFDAVRPVILNGIEDFVTRPDLADRAVFLTLEPIPEERRRPEGELWAAFEAERPRILGALLDAVVEGLKRLSETLLPKLPRMADVGLGLRLNFYPLVSDIPVIAFPGANGQKIRERSLVACGGYKPPCARWASRLCSPVKGKQEPGSSK